MAIRTAAWLAVRDQTREDLANKMHEDVDLALTLHKNDYSIVYNPNMVVGTSGEMIEASPRNFFRYIRRWPNTIESHGKRCLPLYLIIALLSPLFYYPFRIVRFFHNAEFSRKICTAGRKKTYKFERTRHKDSSALTGHPD